MAGVLLDDGLELLQVERNHFGGERYLFLLLHLIVRLVRHNGDLFIDIQIDIQFFD